jgi:tRNA A37 threonylcarbamoyladenosine dehydratase
VSLWSSGLQWFFPGLSHERTIQSPEFSWPRSEEIFKNSRACIIGLGGGGSHVVQQFAHIGIGNFLIFDADQVEDSNLNRLVEPRRKM